jgi:uncharacterized protein (DUF433 family)
LRLKKNINKTKRFELDLLSSGMSYDEILADYEDLAKEDIQACLAFASRMLQVKSIHHIAA